MKPSKGFQHRNSNKNIDDRAQLYYNFQKTVLQLFNYEHMGIEFSKTKFPINVTQIGLYYNIKSMFKSIYIDQ